MDHDLVRIGDKLVSRRRIARQVDRILEMRAKGMSQQDVAARLDLDRTFISRLEALGEVHKGRRIAVVGFPLANKDELEAVCEEEGVEFTLLMTEAERQEFVRRQSGAELVNTVMELAARAREFDTVVVLGSDYRGSVIEALVGKDCILVEIGKSPLVADVYYDPAQLRALLRDIRGKGGAA
ncbi:helix-turn-helix domain-containing protein [Caldinitratiruptor microaerophilus]|uniref:Transcriptional regulator n=1 Tax=Caldinitratiruptor microaerophilus TaxID=671077 RepID=A0AA35CQS3_9FIRM|nr:helix-turn-helix transcriptional regulator [Caldinitratiruptor microaerophilus]BDG62095.1 transcriptional regulator [Caldinitratiruptor microaerophilus]